MVVFDVMGNCDAKCFIPKICLSTTLFYGILLFMVEIFVLGKSKKQ